MHKAEAYPSNSLKVEDDQVIEATFFGHEFTDTYVEILDPFPMCPSSARACALPRLKSTKIKPAAVERLKAMFPNTEVRIQ